MLYEEKENLSDLGIKVTKTASFLAFSSIFNIVVYGLAFIIMARLLGPGNFGIYVIAVGVAGALGAASNFGVGTYLNRQIPYLSNTKDRTAVGRIIGDSFLIVTILGVAIVLVGIGFSQYISGIVFHGTTGAGIAILYVAIASIIFSMLYGTGQAAIVSFGDGRGSAIVGVIYTILQAGVGIALVVLGYGSIGATAGLLIGFASGTAASLFLANKLCRIRFELKGMQKRLRKLLLFSLPIAGANFMMGLPQNLAVLLLGVFTISSIVGNYGLALRLAGVFVSFISAVTLILLPAFSAVLSRKNNYKELGRLYNYSLYVGFLFVTPLAIYLLIFSHALMQTAFPSYGIAYVYIALMSVGVLLQAAGLPASFFIISIGKVRKTLIYSTIVGLSDIVMLILLVPLFGALGAILALYFLGAFLYDYLYIRAVAKEGVHMEVGRILKLLVANLVLAMLMSLILLVSVSSTLKLIIGIIALLVLYPPIVALSRAMMKKDMTLIGNAAKKIPVVSRLLDILLAYARIFARG